MITIYIPATPWSRGVAICVKYAGWSKVIRAALWPS